MMQMLKFLLLFGAILSVVSATAHAQQPNFQEKERQLVREQRAVIVNGVQETWQLVWDGEPSTVCGPEEVYMAITCPCAGVAYTEHGKLSLVRKRGDQEVERMDLQLLFGKSDHPVADKVEGAAYLVRWPLESGDFERENRGDLKLVAEIKRRSAPIIMQFADYDRDGQATEFLIQVGTLPCGKLQFAAVGVSTKELHLHALTSVAKPDTPLIMPLVAWQALLKGPGAHTVKTWACGDHGSDVRTELVVSAGDSQIDVKEREFSCPPDGQAEKLVKETAQ
jgi:hypothetical protein